MYIDTHGELLRGLEARAMFDRTKLEVTKMVQDWGLDKSATITLEEALYVVSSAEERSYRRRRRLHISHTYSRKRFYHNQGRNRA
ncbi:MAG: hypothetical protein KH205_04745 [Ruminococcus sp.]|nr:hypothetical protein [Ruminococcus sp.]